VSQRAPAACALAAACVLGARGAAAEVGARAVTTEVGVGSMLSSDQRELLGYSTATRGALLAGVSMTERWMLQVAVGSWWFPSSEGYGRDTMFGIGLRFEPWVGTLGRLILDAHPAITRSGGRARGGLDAGIGYELAPRPWLGVGPMLRYGQVYAQPEDGTADAKFWSFCLAVTLRAGP
jgi:hypothetical protein